MRLFGQANLPLVHPWTRQIVNVKVIFSWTRSHISIFFNFIFYFFSIIIFFAIFATYEVFCKQIVWQLKIWNKNTVICRYFFQ